MGVFGVLVVLVGKYIAVVVLGVVFCLECFWVWYRWESVWAALVVWGLWGDERGGLTVGWRVGVVIGVVRVSWEV